MEMFLAWLDAAAKGSLVAIAIVLLWHVGRR